MLPVKVSLTVSWGMTSGASARNNFCIKLNTITDVFSDAIYCLSCFEYRPIQRKFIKKNFLVIKIDFLQELVSQIRK